MLIEKDLFKTTDKVAIAIERLRQFEPPEGYYLAFSGGKDSLAIKNLADRAGVKYDAHFNFTTVDSPEILKFIRENHSDVKWDRPKKTMWQLIVTNGPPTRINKFCCRILKKRGGKGRFVLTGVRKKESTNRAKRRMVEHCLSGGSRRFLHPIFDWTEQDVWLFIRQRGLKYCELYDQGFNRIGCVGCPNGGPVGMKKQFKRWPNFKSAYLKAFEAMVEYRSMKGLKLQWQKPEGDIDWRAPEGVMEWWIAQARQRDKVDENQIMLFG